MKNIDHGRLCTGCERPYDGGMSVGKFTWWNLNNYHGFRGFFCPQCYDMVSHDSYSNPTDPEGYLLMTIKLGVQHAEA